MAGALWIPLSDGSQFEDNIRQLYGQIQKLVHSAPEVEEVTDEGTASVTEAKEELERLRIRKDERKTAFRRTRARSEAQDLLRAQDDYARSKRFLSQVCERVERV